MLNLFFANRVNPVIKAMPIKDAQATPPNLAQAASGKLVTIRGFGKLAAQHRQHLQAYGLLPGRSVRVLAQRPVTIVLVEQTELAFETEIARQVLIE